LKNGSKVAGTIVRQNAFELRVAQPGGDVAVVPKRNLEKSEPMTQSLMPAGLEHGLTAVELRDLMTFVLTSSPASASPSHGR
jgi:putative heme-binding domain-containing protein